MRKIRLGAKGGAVAALVLASLLLGGRVGEEIPSPLLAVLPALLLLASDVVGERPVFRRAPLLTGAGLVLIYLVGAWGGGGLWRCLPYAGMAALLVCKAGFFPHGRGKRLACFFWGALLAAAALLTAHPPLRDPEMAGALVGMMEMGILPLLLSFGLAAACRPLLVRRGGLCAALLLSSTLFALAGCNQQEDAKDEPEDTTSQTEAKEQEVSTQEETQEPAGPTAEEILEGKEGPLTEEEYVTVLQQYYDELMTASSEASHLLDQAMMAAQEEEKTAAQINKLELAKGAMENLRPMYTKFIGLEAPEVYLEAQALIEQGAQANDSVMRIYVEMMEAVKDEETGVAEALVLQRELEDYTEDSQNFSKGLHMVLGESVGVSDQTKSELSE